MHSQVERQPAFTARRFEQLGALCHRDCSREALELITNCHTAIFVFDDMLDVFFQESAAPMRAYYAALGAVFDGIEQTPAAFIGLFDGTNTGKMIVNLKS